MSDDKRLQEIPSPSEQSLADEARRLYDRGVRDLDPLVAQKLTAARRAAVAAAGQSRSRSWRWAPGALAASLALVIVAVAPWRTAPDGFEQLELMGTELATDEVELILAEESFEMIEDLEFLEWLAAQSDARTETG